MKKIIIFFVTMAIFPLGITSAPAGQSLIETVANGCKVEIETYCSQVTPGEGRILACLYAHEDKLSAKCEYALYDAAAQLERLQPTAVISIERPGLAEDGRYYNMRGEDITARCAFFDPFLTLASCPTIAIGDGGNEIGMGSIVDVTRQLDIRAARTGNSGITPRPAAAGSPWSGTR